MAYTILNNTHTHASSITLGSTNGQNTYSVTGPVTAGTILTGAGVGNPAWNITSTTSSPVSVNIDEDGIRLGKDADITIGNQSLKEFMEAINKRLAILAPDPELLEEFEALKQAYEHYKTLEALCVNSRRNDD